MFKIWKRMLIPFSLLILFIIGIYVCDAITDPDISGATGAIVLFVIFPLSIVTLVWALISCVRLTYRYLRYPHITAMELEHTRIETLKKQMKEEKESWGTLPANVKKRCRTLRIGGIIGTIAGLAMILTCLTGNMTVLSIGTVILIFGLTAILFSSPNSYNNNVDIVKMFNVIRPTTIENIFTDIRDVDTLMGSAALGKLVTMKQKCLLFGPMPGQNTYLYGYLNNKGTTFYLGEALMDGYIDEIYEQPKFPPHEPDPASASLASVISYNANAEFLKSQLFDFFQEYFTSGNAGPIPLISPDGVYLFDEHFKLTGQSFCLTDTDENPIYQIEATYPLKSFRIYENDSEIFYITKELVHALPTYRFTRRGEFYGVLEKELAFVKDRFVIGTPDGEFSLESMTAMLGYNFRVTHNGELIGLIMDNLSFTFRNVVFNNSVVTVYDERFRDVVTAMAVMAVREIKRDQEKD